MEPHCHLPVPGTPPSSCLCTGTSGTSGTRLSVWPCKWTQTDCGEAPGVVAQCGGSAMGGTGLHPLSVLVCGCVSAWLGFQPVPADSETRAAPKMGCARGCSSDGNSQESGFLRPESCRVAAREEAPAESPLLTPDWPQGLVPMARLGDTGVGRVPTQPQDGTWPPATPHTPLGQPSQHRGQSDAGKGGGCACAPHPANPRLAEGAPQEQQYPDPMAQPAPGWTQGWQGLSVLMWDRIRVKVPPAPRGQWGSGLAPLGGLCGGCAGREEHCRHSGTGSSVISPHSAAAGPWLCPNPGPGKGGHPPSSGTATQPWASLFSLFFSLTQWKTIFERLHHAGVSGAAGGELG